MPHKAGYGVTEECKRQPAREAPYAYQQRTTPSTWKVGGKVVAKGTPEEVAESETSHTGAYLAKLFKKDKKRK